MPEICPRYTHCDWGDIIYLWGHIISFWGQIISFGGMFLLGEHYHFYIDHVGARFYWGRLLIIGGILSLFGGKVLLGAIIIIWGHDY